MLYQPENMMDERTGRLGHRAVACLSAKQSMNIDFICMHCAVGVSYVVAAKPFARLLLACIYVTAAI